MAEAPSKIDFRLSNYDIMSQVNMSTYSRILYFFLKLWS